MRTAPRGFALLFPAALPPASPDFTRRLFAISAAGMERVDELELLMEMSFWQEAEPPAEL